MNSFPKINIDRVLNKEKIGLIDLLILINHKDKNYNLDEVVESKGTEQVKKLYKEIKKFKKNSQ